MHREVRGEVIGEAVKNLSDSLRAQHPEVPWTRIAGMRDVLKTIVLLALLRTLSRLCGRLRR